MLPPPNPQLSAYQSRASTMPTQRIPAAPLGGVTSRRRAELLLHLVHSGGARASVKDLRLRRVTPPASAPLDSSPDGAATKPGSVESTPPDDAPSAEDRELKPMLPRSKLVRYPASFGYRRLLPFLNEMAGNGNSENTADNSKKELNTSYFGLVDESVDGSHDEADNTMDSVEPVVIKIEGDQQMKYRCNIVKDETKIAPDDLSCRKPWLTRCPMSRFVHHPSSLSYKRMLPFLMENELSSQEGDRVKIRRVMEGKQLISDGNNVLASGQHHLAVSKDSPEESNRCEVERTVQVKPSKSDGDYVLDGGRLQPAVSEVPPLECGTAEMQKFRQEEVLTSDGDPLSSDRSELSLAGEQIQVAVSEYSPEESNRAEVERTEEEYALKSDGNSFLDGRQIEPAVSEVSPPEGGAAEMQKATQKQALTPDGDEGNPLTLDKCEFLAKEQPRLCVTEELLKDYAELAEVQHCQSSELRCSDADFSSPTKTEIPLVNRHGALERQDSVASLHDPLLDVGMIRRPADPCAIGTPLSVEEMSGCVMYAESGSSKVGTPRPRGSPPCLEKRGVCPKKLSPKKGILKRHTRGCKGICMCLDCSIFRLHADRAFEFSRKQMQEADDIIGNLLKELASLRCLMEKSAGQESSQAAFRLASRVEEVAKERRRRMLLELNSHCRIPGPRVKFAQYVEEEKMGSSSPRSGFFCNRRR